MPQRTLCRGSVMQPFTTLTLQTERLLIRDFIETDFDAVYAYGSDPEVVRYMVFPPSTPEGTRKHLARCMRQAYEQPRTSYDLGVVLKATNQVIGGISLGVVDRERGEGAFLLVQSHNLGTRLCHRGAQGNGALRL